MKDETIHKILSSVLYYEPFFVVFTTAVSSRKVGSLASYGLNVSLCGIREVGVVGIATLMWFFPYQKSRYPESKVFFGLLPLPPWKMFTVDRC